MDTIFHLSLVCRNVYCSFIIKIKELLVVNEIDMVMKVYDSLWKWTFTFHLLLYKELLFYWLKE